MTNLLLDTKIAIVGGGPAGLTLARLLQRSGAHLTVFERDASALERGQGGSLDLHPDAAQLALAAAGLIEEFEAIARPEDQSYTIFDKDGVVHATLRPDEAAQRNPEIDRSSLRDILLESLAPGTLQWGKSLMSAERDDSHKPLLIFTDGHREAFDLVVGCDGGWSRVRALVTDQTVPFYTGMTWVQSLIHDARRRFPAIADMICPGSASANGHGRAIMGQVDQSGAIRVYIALEVPENWAKTSGLDFTDDEAIRIALLGYFDGWAPELRAIIEACDGDFIPWPLHSYPAHQEWRPRMDVTLAGDAAHIMPPYTGRGVNNAMLDAYELAQHLTSGDHASIGEAVVAYETAMLERMEGAVSAALGLQDAWFGPDAPAGVARQVREMAAHIEHT
jgi:2-polyprenyl-6-methoxyphenol hydroxylase-like FAD-dependent oxidoreductase